MCHNAILDHSKVRERLSREKGKTDQVPDVYPVVYAERGGLTLRWLAAHGSLVRRISAVITRSKCPRKPTNNTTKPSGVLQIVRFNLPFLATYYQFQAK
ncbi:hypothetical protein J6590_047079 [Homalodisca vitripennis]|nr:hypothetical protein J6590_047079 [Homalodisca vitripennis]